MKTVKSLAALTAVSAALSVPTTASAENTLDASVGASSIYLFRGGDDGGGSAAVFGDLTYNVDLGFYAGVWASSAGGSSGGEIDLLAGWGGEFGGLTVDLGVVNYLFPAVTGSDSIGDFSEAYLGLGFAGVEFYVYDNIADGSPAGSVSGGGALNGDYQYYTVSFGSGPVSVLIGYQDGDEPEGLSYDLDFTHVDLTYAASDNLSFTVSKIIDIDDEFQANGGDDDDFLFVVSYSLPIEIK